MDLNFHSIDELYNRLLPALKCKKREMITLKLMIEEQEIWHFFCDNVWCQKKGLTIDEMVDDILNTNSMDIYIRKGAKNENNRQ